jgi:hypothetical protein
VITEEASYRFNELRRREGRVDPRELDELWPDLDTVRIEDVLGEWRGSAIDTGHRAVEEVRKMRWFGKTFTSRLEVAPLICYDEDGNLYSNTEAGNGGASLWMIEFRGEVTAAMVYDGLPVFDHFKKVDEATLLGIMNGEESVFDEGEHFYFVLERI